MQETRGADPFEVLSWRGKDDIAFAPYYDEDSWAKLSFAKLFQVPANGNVSTPAWANLPEVKMSDERTANSSALQHLSNGADGILFDVRDASGTDLPALLHDIEWPFCTIAFDINGSSGIENTLPGFLERRQFDPGSIHGALFWESIPKKSLVQFYLDNCGNFHSLGFSVAQAPPAVEISNALTEGVKALDAFDADQDRALRAICFSVAADASILESAAKVKALRLLWLQVARAYGHNDYNSSDLYIHARSPAVADTLYGPHENMLKGTFTAIAAVVGGCNALTVMVGEKPELLSRWARNVSLILSEESFFNKVADPFAGSYTFDAVVDAIAQKAWKLFQENWKADEKTT